MKHIPFRYLIILSCLLFAACQKDGKLITKERVDNVYREETVMMGGELLYHDAELLSENWCCVDEELYRIDYLTNRPCSENFFYDGKQIVRTTVPAYGIENKLFYNGRKLNRIESYVDGELDCTILVDHNDDKISEMRWIYVMPDTGSRSSESLVSMMLGREIADALAINNEQLKRQSKGKGNVEILYHFDWDDDEDNVIRISSGDWIAEMTYDENYNPYHNLFGYNEMHDPLFGFEMLSKNNIRTITMPYQSYGTTVFTYTYEYKDHFPKERTLTFSYTAPGYGSFELTDYSVTRIERFEYK